MEERRFDDLTRALGRGASRRQVLKGLLGAALGGALAAVGLRAPQTVLAATTCNGVPFDPSTQCCETSGVQPVYPIADLDLCPNRVPHPGHVPAFNGCGPAQGFISHIIPNRIGPTRNIDFTSACNNHDICYDTCNSVKSECDRNFLADMSAACAAAYPGRGFVDRYLRTACTADAYIYYTAVSQTAAGTEAYESAQKQACDCCAICAECGGPGDERCCNGLCHAACPVGYHRDAESCDCIKDDDGGGKGGDCPVCQSGTAGNCVPDSSQDGLNCGACGKCANGACRPDPNRTCPTCHECSEAGACVEQEDNSPCGDSEVCCSGTCISGTACGPCAPNWHQCPADTNGHQICCPDGQDCCTDESTGVGRCGPAGGGCDPCPSGQHQCPSPSTGGPRICCIDELECCEDNSICGPLNDSVGCCGTGMVTCGSSCCAAESCQTADNGAQYCCGPDAAGVTNNGTCCPAGESQCVSVCCDDETEFCLPTDTGMCCQNGQVRCVTMCCQSDEQCVDDNATGGTVCCPGDSTGYAGGRCCAGGEEVVQCADGSWQCCALEASCC